MIYNNPKEHDRLMATGRARLTRSLPVRSYRWRPIKIYELA